MSGHAIKAVAELLEPATVAADAAALRGRDDLTEALLKQRHALLEKLVAALRRDTLNEGAVSYDVGSFADAADWIERGAGR